MIKRIENIILILALLVGLTLLLADDDRDIDSSMTEESALSLPFKVETDSVSYVADSIYYDVKNDKITLTSGAKMKYRSSEVKSDQIIIDLSNDQVNTVGETWLIEGAQELYGDGVSYNIESEKGIIASGTSRFEKGFYNGREIRKIDEEVYDVDDGYFTTCDNKEPHFYINAKQMRLYYKDKVVAKPVTFYVNHFPVLFIPFGTFSIKTDRTRGFLVPEPGYNSVDGKYIENIAYYTFYDDYVEALAAIDWREKTGWEGRFESKYLKRYFFNGSFDARFQNRTESAGTSRQEWYLRGRHRQDFIDNSSLDANLEFISSKTIWESSENIDERLNEKVTSSIAYRKQLLSTTISSGANYTENLTDKTKQIILPTLSFTLPSKPVYELFTTKDYGSEAWWRNFSYSYSFRGVHSGNIIDPDATFADILYNNKMDENGKYLSQHNAGIKHSGGLSYNQIVYGWLNFSQSVEGSEVWFDRSKERDRFVRGNDYSTNTRLSASLYGIGNYPNFKISAVRHVVTPAVSFNYAPDFSKNEEFYSFSGISLNSGKKRRNLAFSLDNKWSAKIYNEKLKQDKAINDIISLSSTVSYDLEKESKPFTDIDHSLSFRPGSINISKLNLNYSSSGSIRQDPYDFDITNWRVNNSITVGGNSPYKEYFTSERNVLAKGAPVAPVIDDFDDSFSVASLSKSNPTNRSYPWTASLNHDYSRTKGSDRYSSNLRASLSFRLTANWILDYSSYYNLEKGDLISQSLSVDRELHCWKIKFSWTKQGDYWNYKVQIFNVNLPDALKLKHSDYRRG
ncbi:MAG: putative LPS assembly protein LptD [Candidatus Cloacimonadia bacterium]